MSTHFLPTISEWNNLSLPLRAELTHWLRKHFRRLNEPTCEDVAGQVDLETRNKISQGQPFILGSPQDSDEHHNLLRRYAYLVARSRAKDAIRLLEREILGDFTAGDDGGNRPEPSDPYGETPSQLALRSEAEERKSVTLAAIIEDCCRECEAQPRMLTGKQVFERTLRGESADAIAAAMQMNKQAVQAAQTRALDRFEAKLNEHDPRGSALPTLRMLLGVDESAGYRCNANLPRYIENIELLRRYLFDESGACCPREDRLERFADHPNDADLSDIRYHVREAGCPLCLALLPADFAAPPTARE